MAGRGVGSGKGEGGEGGRACRPPQPGSGAQGWTALCRWKEVMEKGGPRGPFQPGEPRHCPRPSLHLVLAVTHIYHPSGLFCSV